MAIAALRNKDLAQAEQAVRAALRLDPQSCALHLLYGMILRRRLQLSSARAEFQRAIALDPSHPWPYYFLGAIYLSYPVPLADEARPYVYKAVELDPEDAQIQALLARQAIADGNLALAAQAYRRALALAPQDAMILSDYGDFLLHRQVQPQEALHVLKEAIRLDPNDKQTQKRLLKAIRAAHPLYRPIVSYRAFLRQASQGLRLGVGLAASLFTCIAGRLLLSLTRALSDSSLASRNPLLSNISLILLCLGFFIVSPYGFLLLYRAVMAPLLLFLIKRGWIK
jgi:tetratricopeptide (TPR) repeat protein